MISLTTINFNVNADEVKQLANKCE